MRVRPASTRLRSLHSIRHSRRRAGLSPAASTLGLASPPSLGLGFLARVLAGPGGQRGGWWLGAKLCRLTQQVRHKLPVHLHLRSNGSERHALRQQWRGFALKMEGVMLNPEGPHRVHHRLALQQLRHAVVRRAQLAARLAKAAAEVLALAACAINNGAFAGSYDLFT